MLSKPSPGARPLQRLVSLPAAFLGVPIKGMTKEAERMAASGECPSCFEPMQKIGDLPDGEMHGCKKCGGVFCTRKANKELTDEVSGKDSNV